MQIIEPTTRRGEAGIALTVMIFLVLAVAAFAAGLLSFTHSVNRAAESTFERVRAFQIADSGIDRALAEMISEQDPDEDGCGAVTGAIDGGTYTVEITPPFTGPGIYVLRATGVHNRARKSIEAVIGSEDDQKIPNGFFGADLISMSGESMVDSYDSRLGTYERQATNVDATTGFTYAALGGSIGSNSDIVLADSAAVFGSATPGPDGVVSMSDDGYVSDSTAAATSTTRFEAQSYEDVVAGKLRESVTVGGEDTLRVRNDKRFAELVLTDDATIVIKDDVTLYIDGDLLIDGNAQIVVKPGAKLTVYVNGKIRVTGRGIVNEKLDPSKVVVHQTSDRPTKLKGKSNFYGVIYAPNSRIVARGKAQYFGALVGAEIEMEDEVKFHWDRSLSDFGVSGKPRWKVKRWDEL